LPKTCCPSSTSLLQEIMGYAPPKIENRDKKKRKKNDLPEKHYKSKKIRLVPSSPQTKLLNHWFGVSRWTFNQCVQLSKSEHPALTKSFLRSKFVNATAQVVMDNDWIREVPYEIRDHAVSEFIQARKAGFTQLASGMIDHFDIGFRSKKSRSQSISLRVRGWNGTKRIPFPKSWDGLPLKSTELIPVKLLADSIIQRTRDGVYHLCLVEPIVIQSESQVLKTCSSISTKNVIASLDPGVRTFQTVYSPEGVVTEWGKDDFGRIYRLCYAADKLQSKMYSNGCLARKRKSYRKAAIRIRRKIRQLVDELHCKLCKWLCESYRIVLLPEFKTQIMVKRGKRQIQSKTARAMLTWSHYRFKQKLLSKCREYDTKVVIVTEEYTSKTCGRCGRLNNELGGDRTYVCRDQGCGYIVDRDHNGARNILLKWIKENW